MQKNLILVFILTFVVIILAQKYFFKAPQPPAGEPQEKQQIQTQAPAKEAPAPQAQAAAAKPATAPSAQNAAVKQATSEGETVVENDLYRIVFTNKGAQVKSWVLKKYNDSEGKPLELVHQKGSEQYGYPLSFWTWDQGLREKLNTALYVTDAGAQLKTPGTLSFEYSDGNLVVRKSFEFSDSYVIGVKTSVEQNGKYVTALPSWPTGFGDMSVPATYAAQRIDYYNGDKVERLSSDKKGAKISNGRVVQGTLQWAGAVDQYFAAIFLPDNPQQAAMAELRSGIEIPKDPKKPENKETFKVELLGVAVGALDAPVNTRLFVGPKAVNVLESVHPASGQGDLRAVVDFGMFSFIARPLFIWLQWTYQHWVSNWGWAIIILTVIINVVLMPLRIISMRSALKMQRVAPQVQSINDKYKKYSLKDPRRAEAQKEIAALYKEHNVNPVGGCFPLLLQMPFLFAFWAMLSAAIELRGAHWFWLKDLAQPDHLYIIPIVIVVSTMLMQKMTPQAGMNPEQARMMNMMMPLMLGFMSWSVASGLGLYWLTGTVVAIAQQWGMNQTSLGREIRQEMEKRARKAKK